MGFYRATLHVTCCLGLHGLIQRTDPLSRLLRQTRSAKVPNFVYDDVVFTIVTPITIFLSIIPAALQSVFDDVFP